jgi:hypothetical protein
MSELTDREIDQLRQMIGIFNQHNTFTGTQDFKGPVHFYARCEIGADIYDRNGNKIIELKPQTNAVDYLQIINGATAADGGGVSVAAVGSDANTKLAFYVNGASTVAQSNAETHSWIIFSGNAESTTNTILELTPIVDGLRFFRMMSAPESGTDFEQAPKMIAVGHGTNPGMVLGTQQLGKFYLGANMGNNTILILNSVSSATDGADLNHLEIINAATPSGPTISSEGVDTNIPITIAPKGTGKVLLTKKLNATGLPTSSSGLATGDIWVDTTGGLNILKIV